MVHVLGNQIVVRSRAVTGHGGTAGTLEVFDGHVWRSALQRGLLGQRAALLCLVVGRFPDAELSTVELEPPIPFPPTTASNQTFGWR
jgi:hypothetical protein